MNSLFNKLPLVLLLLLSCVSGRAASTVVRSVLENYTANPFVVIEANPDASVSVYAVQEDLPAGLTPTNITQGGVWDAVNQAVKWGPWFTNTEEVLVYTVTGAPGTYTVSGVGSFDGASVPTTGDNQIVIPPVLTNSTVVRTITGGTNVTLVATPAPGVSSCAVQDNLPAGLTPTNITQGGTWDAANQAVKWGPWYTNTAQTLSYTVTGSPGTFTVSGLGSFDGVSVQTTGATQIVIATNFVLPMFITQPVSEVVGSGQPVTFTAAATGSPPPAYQWQFDGTNIAGATAASYEIPSANLGNIGLYDVMIANSAGSIVSSNVSLGFLDLKMLAAVYLTGPIGSQYEIQAAAALAPTNWITVTNVTIPTQPFIWVDYSSATNAQQFYRAVPQ
jgi:hypothetical protein